ESVEAKVPTERPPAPSTSESTASKILGSILPKRSKKPVPTEPTPEFIALRGAEDTLATSTTLPANVVQAALAGSRDRLSMTPGQYADPSVARYETLVERGAWEQLAKELMVVQSPSPAVKLLGILAARETAPANDKGGGKLTQEAITTLATLLGVPASS